jgi:hypothetical protein
MTLEWARLQDIYLQQIQSATDAKSGTLWTTNIITTIWKSFFLMWHDRNTDIHGADSDTRQVCRRRQAALALHHLHKKRHDVLATDRDLFIGNDTADLDLWVTNTTATHIENWLRIWKPVILDSAKAAHTFALKSVKPIHDYFVPTRPHRPSRRPPKPRYDSRAHTRYDRNQVRKKPSPEPPPRNHSITAFFRRRPLPNPTNPLV